MGKGKGKVGDWTPPGQRKSPIAGWKAPAGKLSPKPKRRVVHTESAERNARAATKRAAARKQTAGSKAYEALSRSVFGPGGAYHARSRKMTAS